MSSLPHPAPQVKSAPDGGAVPRGFGNLPCPLCGEQCCVQLDLDGLDLFTCRECSAEFSPADLRERVAKWERVLAWIDQAPRLEGGAR